MACTFTITGQRQTTMPNPAGAGFTDAMEVRFTSSEGVPGKVTVPMAQYSADNVRTLIERQCETISAVQNLSS